MKVWVAFSNKTTPAVCEVFELQEDAGLFSLAHRRAHGALLVVQQCEINDRNWRFRDKVHTRDWRFPDPIFGLSPESIADEMANDPASFFVRDVGVSGIVATEELRTLEPPERFTMALGRHKALCLRNPRGYYMVVCFCGTPEIGARWTHSLRETVSDVIETFRAHEAYDRRESTKPL